MFGDLIAFAFVIATFVIVLMAWPIRKSFRLRSAAAFVLLLHHLVAFVNAFVFTVPGADADASTFHRTAVAIIDGTGISREFYVDLLTATYRLFGVSHFLGEQLSVTAFALSLVVFCRLCVQLRGTPPPPIVLIAFGATPSVLMFTSVTLRESFQMLLVVVAAYATLRMRHRRGWRGLILLGAAVIAMTVFHQALAMYGAAATLLSLYWAYWSGRGRRLGRAAIALIVVAGVLTVWASMATEIGAAGKALFSGKLLQAAASYRINASVLDARTNYGVGLSFSSPMDFLFNLPILFLYYMTTPFPWQIGSLMDVVAFAEVMLRMILLVVVVRNLKRMAPEERSRSRVMLLLYLGLELIWSTGTLNWGTAIRHHVPGYALLFALGGPILFAARSRVRKGRRSIRKGRAAMPSPPPVVVPTALEPR